MLGIEGENDEQPDIAPRTQVKGDKAERCCGEMNPVQKVSISSRVSGIKQAARIDNRNIGIDVHRLLAFFTRGFYPPYSVMGV